MNEILKCCSTCKIEKPLSEFHKYKNSIDGHTHRCKRCVSRKQTKLNDIKKCSVCNEIKTIESFNKRKNGEFGRSSICKVCNNKKMLQYRNENRIKLNENRNKWRNEKRKTDVIFKLKSVMRCRLYGFLKNRKMKKNNTTFNIIGCSPEELKVYIEKQFVDGMTWVNYNYETWHIDHIIPLYCTKTEDDVYKLFHYSNLQPLWSKDNMKKGFKY